MKCLAFYLVTIKKSPLEVNLICLCKPITFGAASTDIENMARKRKRACFSHQSAAEKTRKRVKTSPDQRSASHHTLCLYYTRILTLREYLLFNLPKTSKTRRRKIASRQCGSLDEILVCTTVIQQAQSDQSRYKDFETFSQQVTLSTGSSIGEGSTCQSELIDFAIWLLFHRIHRHVHKPPHMLCYGYQRAGNPTPIHGDQCALAGIPGIVSHYPNSNVNILKNAFWTETLGLLGSDGERIMLDLVLDCGVFVAASEGRGNYFQLSGAYDRTHV